MLLHFTKKGDIIKHLKKKKGMRKRQWRRKGARLASIYGSIVFFIEFFAAGKIILAAFAFRAAGK